MQLRGVDLPQPYGKEVVEKKTHVLIEYNSTAKRGSKTPPVHSWDLCVLFMVRPVGAGIGEPPLDCSGKVQQSVG